MDKVSKSSNKVSVVASGWDPGMFSINRLYGEVFLPQGKGYTFWGKGLVKAIPMQSAGLRVLLMESNTLYLWKKP